ncbi:hypothetical protein SMZ82_003480 [Cronobacter malonaticus]|uniref:hypothetical protein n=1 Tax=Cronobacter malonaticus TaxID=413503 RepID=UPI001054C016|nr:hypothetical protein [Cronobacter malonaticus]ELY4584132.1 hypothetical protein [Cronobacter malonaticus]ELY4803529.1 hypothetical protein [Cronobacter malonaticus]MDI6404178.1 hypothetical protein [Cronobacter malonaticus]
MADLLKDYMSATLPWGISGPLKPKFWFSMVMFIDCVLTASLCFLNDYFYDSTADSKFATPAMDFLTSSTTLLIASSVRAFYFTNVARNSLTLINSGFLRNMTTDPTYTRCLYNFLPLRHLVDEVQMKLLCIMI